MVPPVKTWRICSRFLYGTMKSKSVFHMFSKKQIVNIQNMIYFYLHGVVHTYIYMYKWIYEPSFFKYPQDIFFGCLSSKAQKLWTLICCITTLVFVGWFSYISAPFSFYLFYFNLLIAPLKYVSIVLFVCSYQHILKCYIQN